MMGGTLGAAADSNAASSSSEGHRVRDDQSAMCFRLCGVPDPLPVVAGPAETRDPCEFDAGGRQESPVAVRTAGDVAIRQ